MNGLYEMNTISLLSFVSFNMFSTKHHKSIALDSLIINENGNFDKEIVKKSGFWKEKEENNIKRRNSYNKDRAFQVLHKPNHNLLQ